MSDFRNRGQQSLAIRLQMSFCAVSNEVKVGWEMFFVMFSLVPQSMLICKQTILPKGVLRETLFIIIHYNVLGVKQLVGTYSKVLQFYHRKRHKHTALQQSLYHYRTAKFRLQSMTLLVHFLKFESLKNPVCFSACSLPVWVLLFGQTLSRSCWQRRSFLGPS